MTVGLYEDVVGQERAVANLKAAAARPVHAYLFVGPAGTGKSRAAISFAAALLAGPTTDPGTTDPGTTDPGTTDPGTDDLTKSETRRRVLAGIHPDVVHFEREGPAISMPMAREIARLAVTSPLEGARKVLVLHDFHLVREAGPALLKTIEEPPPSTFFIILAEYVPPDLVTIASRCVRVDFNALSPAEVVNVLRREGVEAERAAALAEAAGGRLDRARTLAADPQFEARRQAWRQVPARLDGTGASAAAIADELAGLLEASVEPLRVRQNIERTELEEGNARAAQVAGTGRAGKAGARTAKTMLASGVAEMETRHRREQRRQRTDELRSGLATLAGAYRDRLISAPDGRRRTGAITALDHIDKLARDLEYNPGELLALQALLTRLGRIGA